MTNQEIARAALDAIVAAEIDYVLVGGLAVIAHTFPRTTLDADFVIAAPMASIGLIERYFPAAFHVDPQPVMELLTGTHRWMVDVDGSTFKVEIFLLGNDLHHAMIFQRRIKVDVPDFIGTVWIPTAEDLVVQKLRWARSKDLDDALNILSVAGSAIDYPHIEKWCEAHGTLDRLTQVRSLIPPDL